MVFWCIDYSRRHCRAIIIETGDRYFMRDFKTVVASSPIHGRGLFASKCIKKGETIGIAEGRKTTRDGDHVLWLNNKEGIKVSCDLRFINHDDKPNATYYDTLEVIALTDIQPGEEITHYYHQSHE